MADIDAEMEDAGAVAGSSTGPGTVEGRGRRKRVRETNPEDLDSEEAGIQDEDEQHEDEGPRRKKGRYIPPRPSPKPKTPNDWHLKKAEVPKTAKSTKLALEVHLRALWELPHQNAVPPPVTSSDIEHFNWRFQSEDDVCVSVTSSLDANEAGVIGARTRVKSLLASLSGPYSITSNHIKRISEEFLLTMFRTVAYFGLSRWAPDILSCDPDSMYNLLHEHIALVTFQQVSASYGYFHVANNLAHVRNPVLMRKLYRSFVYSHMVNIAKLEAKQPGKVAMLNDMGNVWKRRQDLARSRAEHLKDQGSNEHVLALAEENEAHSNDELAPPAVGGTNPGEPVYHIKQKEGCAQKVTNFFRTIDEQRRQKARRRGRHQKIERRREEPNPPKESSLTAQPKSVPIDWFEPDYWNNSLTVHERLDFIRDGVSVAMPLQDICQDWKQVSNWKNLPEKHFMEVYGNAVLELYNMPTDEELEQLDMWENPELYVVEEEEEEPDDEQDVAEVGNNLVPDDEDV